MKISKFNLLAILFFLFFSALVIDANAEDYLSFERCKEYAIENNLALQAAGFGIKASSYELDFQKKQFLPRIDFGISTGYLDGESTSPFATVRGSTEDGVLNNDVSDQYISSSMSLSIPVIKEGVFSAENAPSVSIARNQLLLNERSYEDYKNQLTYEVGISYVNLLKNKEGIRNAEEHLKFLEHVHETALSKYRSDMISKNELLRSSIKLESRKIGLEIAKNETRTYMAELSIKMGQDPAKKISISDDDLKLPVIPSLDELINIALSKPNELMTQEIILSLSKEKLRRSENKKYPVLDFVTSYNMSNDYSSNSNTMWIAKLQLTMPLFDFGAVDSKIRSHRARTSKEAKQFLFLEQRITQQVIKAYMHKKNTDARIILKKKMVEQFTENAKLVRARYEENLDPLDSALEAEYKLYDVQKSLLQARYDSWIAYLNLNKLTGGKL